MTTRSGRRLIVANLVLVGATVLHDLDHVRQARTVALPVVVLGLIGEAIALASLGLAIGRVRLAAPAAIVVGFGTALGFVAVHALPHWSAISDAYPDLPVDGLSWASVVLAIVAAMSLGLAGLAELRSARSALAQAK